MTKTEETKIEKARALRYRKAIAKDVNLQYIQEDLYDIWGRCDDVRYFFTPNDETLLNALDGDEDAENEFKVMFSELSYECEKMQSDLENEYIPECFDDFFTAISSREDTLFGYDSYEGDYFGLSDSVENEWAIRESAKRLKTLTKDKIIEAAQVCFRVYRSYIGIRHRYDCLEAAMDVLKDENTEYLKTIQQINEVYEKANNDEFREWEDSVQIYNRLVAGLPSKAWIE